MAGMIILPCAPNNPSILVVWKAVPRQKEFLLANGYQGAGDLELMFCQ